MVNKTRASMPFWEHVEEFRRRLIVAAVFVLAGAVTGYFLFPFFVSVLRQSLGEDLYAFEIAEGFLVRLKIALSLGLFFSLPIIIFQIVLFVLPALKPREKGILFAFLASSYILFLGGLAFAFAAVLPYSIQFLKSADFFPAHVGRILSFRDFLDFFMTILVGFGVCFQFPIVMLLTIKFGALPFSFFTKNFKFMVIVIFIVAAVITPPDVVSQITLALPMLALYGLTLLVARLTGLGRKNKPRRKADGKE